MDKNKPQKIGKYTLLRLIGKGGMGEIFLAKDPTFERTVALKRILTKLIHYPSIKRRFLSEAKIAAQLTHPSILSIYSLHVEEKQIYYTMPYIEGETLKEILKATRIKEKLGEAPHPLGNTISTLIRLFLSVCQAMHYAHTKGFLHRDLKPENIMVGKFGEVMIFDWGIAHPIGKPEEDPLLSEINTSYDLTKPGKVVGTISYMAPERSLGKEATIQTDIYSLGVILYQLLTLRLPFIRPSLRDFRKSLKYEQWIEPQEIAPHRDIPIQLSHIAKKCLEEDPSKRYQSVSEMIDYLENYIEGCPEWIPSASLTVNSPEDWEFQENVLLSKHMAISRISNVLEWVMLMISKESFSGNMRIEAKLEITNECLGIGFLICIPEPSERKGLEDGYCLWMGTQKNPSCTLFRSNVEVIHVPDVYLEENKKYLIAIEKIDNHFHLLINGQTILSYASHIPLVGGHLGMLLRDTHFKLDKLDILLGSQNVMVNCLSVPDAFLMSKDYTKALGEYRRIAHSFKGRVEGREALFRAGITILKQAKSKNNPSLYSEALNEFEKLHNTPGAPLEYLGKSLVYRFEKILEEEIKCLELAIRKYPKHPLISVIEEHIGFRLHETARTDRKGGYSFLLLALCHVPKLLASRETQMLIDHLITDWEKLYFIETPSHFSSEPLFYQHLASEIAFWLAKPIVLYELLQKIERNAQEYSICIGNIFFALLEMGYHQLIQYVLKKQLKDGNPEFLLLKNYFEIVIETQPNGWLDSLDLFFHILPQEISIREARISKYLFEKCLFSNHIEKLPSYFDKLKNFNQTVIDFKPLEIWTFLCLKEKEKAKKLFVNEAIDPTSEYFFLYGCFLAQDQGEKKALDFFEPLLDIKYPRITALLSYYLKEAIQFTSSWIDNAFWFEKVVLFRQLSLYYFCLGKKGKSEKFSQMADDEIKKFQIPLNFI